MPAVVVVVGPVSAENNQPDNEKSTIATEGKSACRIVELIFRCEFLLYSPLELRKFPLT